MVPSRTISPPVFVAGLVRGGREAVDASHVDARCLLIEEPLIGLAQTGVEVDLRRPPSCCEAADVEHLAWRAVWLGGIELQLGRRVDEVADLLGEPSGLVRS